MCFRPAAVEMTNKCQKCGFENPITETHCKQCGAELPKVPGMPGGAPGAPGMPGMPAAPGAPAAPKAPGK